MRRPHFLASMATAIWTTLFALVGTNLWAAIEVAPAFYTGSRTTTDSSGSGGGLIWNPAGGSWSNGGFSISWLITDNGSDFTYKYTIDTSAATPPGGGLSHWILQLSPQDASGQSLTDHWEMVFDGLAQGEIPTNPTSGNPGIPGGGITYGVRLGNASMVTFTTPEIPVWGDFYAKDGGGNDAVEGIYAYNAGFGTDPAAAGPFLNWIPRPDGMMRTTPGGDPDIIPEAMSIAVWTLLIGCAGLVTWHQRRHREA